MFCCKAHNIFLHSKFVTFERCHCLYYFHIIDLYLFFNAQSTVWIVLGHLSVTDDECNSIHAVEDSSI